MNSRYKKILGLDTWTRGAHHFERLVPALADRDMTLRLVHLGSWGNDRGRPTQEKIGKLEVRDISYFRTRSLDKVLDEERPDAVLLLHTLTFANRALLRYCRQRRIPTLHLYHGLVNVQVTSDTRGSYRVDRVAHAKLVASRFRKLLTYTLPCYIESLYKTRASLEEWKRFLVDIGKMVLAESPLVGPDDARTTKGAVYTHADIEHAVRTYGFAPSDVHAVGNPDLGHFGLTRNMLASHVRRSKSPSDPVMYIDTGLVASGLTYSSLSAFIDHLVKTSRALADQGRAMFFKPHPAHDLRALQRKLEGSGVQLVTGERFLDGLQTCAACIVEPTTLTLIPALMGMPLLYANYDQLRDLRFGPVLTTYPRGYLLRDLSEITAILEKDSAVQSREGLDEWIADNAGPLPAEEMPNRVAQLLQSMIATFESAQRLRM